MANQDSLEIIVLKALREVAKENGYLRLTSIGKLSKMPKGSRIVFTDSLAMKGLIKYNPSGPSSAMITQYGLNYLSEMEANNNL